MRTSVCTNKKLASWTREEAKIGGCTKNDDQNYPMTPNVIVQRKNKET